MTSEDLEYSHLDYFHGSFPSFLKLERLYPLIVIAWKHISRIFKFLVPHEKANLGLE